jgi:hypothetical protein
VANPYSRNLVWAGIGLIAVVILVFSYVLITDDGPPIIRQGVQVVRELAFPTSDRPAAEPAAPETPVKPIAPTIIREPAPAPAASSPTVSAARRGAAPVERPAPTFTRGTAAPLPAKPVARRTDFYLPGSVSGWTTVDVVGGVPLRLRAGGVVNTPDDSSGPEGVKGSAFERALERRRTAATSERVMANGPYLALIGRVCLEGVCSNPFVVGSTRLLCPAEFASEGRLQLWTNNYVQVEGTRTLNRFSSATGGFAIYAEPAPSDVCNSGGGGAVPAPDIAVLTAGQTLRKPEFLVSSSQTTWKPFFVPLTMPLRLSSSGQMQPRGGARSTGPEGLRVPEQSRWVYPGTSDLVVDGQNRLYDSRFPYQALIGRLCGSQGCGQAFLVGREHTICATSGYSDRLELWINHIMRPESMLGTQLSVSMEALEMQGRRGEYRFEVSRAPASACNGS